MRVVSKFQFSAAAGLAADRVANVIESWAGRKFQTNADGSTVIRRTGLPARFERRDERLDDTAQTIFRVVEPISGGQLQTQAKILNVINGIRFNCALFLEMDGGLNFPRVDLGSPRFIREIIEMGFEWHIRDGTERIFSKCFNVEQEDVPELVNLITASERRLPVILVSELQGETLAGDLHERISGDTCGLAHTCRLSSEASWELTAALGKEWSCYNGSVRLLWPFRMDRGDFRAHPLWTSDYLIRRADTAVGARDRLRHDLIDRLFEASTFVADDPAFSQFETEKIRSVNSEDRASATESGDFRELADLYATENDDLRAALAAKTEENDTLQQNIEALTIAVRSAQTTATGRQITNEPPPTSVAEAVHIARATLGDLLAFPNEVDGQVTTLDPTAGPPDKVLRYLQTLAELSKTLSGDEALGKSIPIWLRDRNVECSGVSKTMANNKEARQQRTFTIGKDKMYCEYHAKPSDGVAPDLCVRIYFAVAKANPRIRVGYIGRHFD